MNETRLRRIRRPQWLSAFRLITGLPEAIGWQWIGVVITFTTALVLFAKVGEDVFEHESGTFDGVIRAWMLAHRTRFGTEALTAVTVVGSTIPVTVVALLTALWLWVGHRRRVASVVVAAAAASTSAFVAIKQFFARLRPGVTAPVLAHRVSYAFPSGHATVSAAVLSTVAYVLWRERLLRGRIAAVAPFVLFVTVGISRLYLDRHWATDVLGGWCLGLGIAAASGALYEFWRTRGSDVNPVVANEKRNHF